MNVNIQVRSFLCLASLEVHTKKTVSAKMALFWCHAVKKCNQIIINDLLEVFS